MLEIYNDREIIGPIPESYLPLYPSESIEIPSEGMIITNYSQSIKYIFSRTNKKFKIGIKPAHIEIDTDKTTKVFIEEGKIL